MLENLKSINNPLTVIAIFAALSEISMTVALQFVSADLQATFIWFVMLFPVFLVLAFFVTLNFNHRVLYAPSDFRDDATFIQMHSLSRASGSLERAENQLEQVTDKVLHSLAGDLKRLQDKDREAISSAMDSAIREIVDNVVDANDEVKKLRWSEKLLLMPRISDRVLLALLGTENEKGPLAITISELMKKIPGASRMQLHNAIRVLTEDNLVIRSRVEDDPRQTRLELSAGGLQRAVELSSSSSRS